MPIILGLASLILLAVLFGPQWWVRRVLAHHGAERPDLPGTGGELARHLLDEAGLRVLAPVVFILVKAPILLVLQVVAGLALLAMRIVVHVVTLPVEFDASFEKALPVLEHGRYLSKSDMPAAHSVLRAAAWTYVAAALATLLDVARWFRVLKF